MGRPWKESSKSKNLLHNKIRGIWCFLCRIGDGRQVLKRRQRNKEENGEKSQTPNRSMEPKGRGWWEIAGGKKDRRTWKNSHVYHPFLNCLQFWGKFSPLLSPDDVVRKLLPPTAVLCGCCFRGIRELEVKEESHHVREKRETKFNMNWKAQVVYRHQNPTPTLFRNSGGWQF